MDKLGTEKTAQTGQKTPIVPEKISVFWLILLLLKLTKESAESENRVFSVFDVGRIES